MHITYKKGWKQGQKLFKKESDVGMLLTGIQGACGIDPVIKAVG